MENITLLAIGFLCIGASFIHKDLVVEVRILLMTMGLIALVTGV